MIIDEDGEVSDITEEDFKRARRRKLPDVPAERLYRVRKILVDDDVAERYEQIADEKGIHVSKLVTATLKDYLEREISVDIK